MTYIIVGATIGGLILVLLVVIIIVSLVVLKKGKHSDRVDPSREEIHPGYGKNGLYSVRLEL